MLHIAKQRRTEGIGCGQFGDVFTGIWTSSDGECEVAIKSLILDDAGSKVKFLQEAAVMSQFNHPNIIQLLGVVAEGSPVRSYVIDAMCTMFIAFF